MELLPLGCAVPQQHPPSADAAQEEFNRRLYSRYDLVRVYAVENLSPAEATLLVRCRDDILGRRVLDLGCGAGRLTSYLRPLTDRYAGLDVSPHMIAHCRRRFPGLTFVQDDMRRLPFSAEAFDVVFAVCNLLDAVGHDDRLRVLAEVHRVLVPGGLLIFSAHNRNSARLGEGPRLSRSRNPLTQLRHVAEYVRALRNRWRIRPHEHVEAGYALVNDSGHNFAVLHYYISKERQMEQLAGCGFQWLECLAESGLPLQPGDDDRDSASLHYAARREDHGCRQAAFAVDSMGRLP